MKRALIVGGTGFLGYHAACVFLENGWEVSALGLPPAPPDDFYPGPVKIILLNIEAASDKDLKNVLTGHEAVVFAAGLDDRSTPKKPAYPKFHQANVAGPVRLLKIAQNAGVRRAVILGSYFSFFQRQWPQLKLAERHPYIRSRAEQEQAVLSIPGLEVMVLELPYIFGSMPWAGWRPLWQPLVRYIRSSKILVYMRGGSACISARVAGRAIFGAIQRGQAGMRYPIGQENLTWRDLLSRLAVADGRKVRVITLPTWLIRIAMQVVNITTWLSGRESGLNLRYFHSLQTAETYIDPAPSQQALGYRSDDLDLAFRETVKACGK